MAAKNWRVAKYTDRKSALVKQSEEILDRAAKDGDREPTAEESAQLTANRAELDGLAAKIQREEELARYVFETHESAASGFEKGAPGAPETKVGNARAAFEQDPKRGFKSPREFILTVLNHGDRPVETARDERLRFLAAAGSDEQGSYSDPYGGFLIPMGFHPELMQVTPEEDPIGSRTTKVPMDMPRVEIPARTDKDHSTGSVTGGLLVTRRAETMSQNATRMQMERVAMLTTNLFGLSYVTEELLTDSPTSFAAILEKGFGDQFKAHLLNERLFGTGVGEFEGVMNSPALISVSKDVNQAAATITYNNIINMRSRCWNYQRAVYLYNHDCLPQLMQLHFVPTDAATALAIPIWQTSAIEGEPDRLLGRPAYPTEFCQTVGTTGDLILGVWDEYLEGTYEPLQSAESVHVRFVNHERTFKFWMRNAGRVWWRTPLTPRRSASTLSPFVALATRA
ncbi:MAG: phage major capsid protein [Candidatus Aminicenantales bacterium]|jgi:HK97 family phage major capsid protein